MTTATKWLAGTNAVLGLWMLVVPFLFDAPTWVVYNGVVIGTLIVAMGVYNAYLARITQSETQAQTA